MSISSTRARSRWDRDANSEAFAAFLGPVALGPAEQLPRDEPVKGLHNARPRARERPRAGEQRPLPRCQPLRQVRALVLQQMAKVLAGERAKQRAAPAADDRELKVHDRRASVRRAEPVRLLREIVMRDPAPMK